MARCQEIIGYHFEDINLLREALDTKAHQRLAIVGDHIAETLIVDRWYGVKSLTPENWELGVKACLSNKNLAEIGIKNGFAACMSPKESGPPWSERNTKPVADTVEAVLGAVYRDAVYKNGNRDLAGWIVLERMIDRLGITARLLVAYSHRQWTLEALRTKNMLPSHFFNGHQRSFVDILDKFSNEKRPIILPRDAMGHAIHRPLHEAPFAKDHASDTELPSKKLGLWNQIVQKLWGSRQAKQAVPVIPTEAAESPLSLAGIEQEDHNPARLSKSKRMLITRRRRRSRAMTRAWLLSIKAAIPRPETLQKTDLEDVLVNDRPESFEEFVYQTFAIRLPKDPNLWLAWTERFGPLLSSRKVSAAPDGSTRNAEEVLAEIQARARLYLTGDMFRGYVMHTITQSPPADMQMWHLWLRVQYQNLRKRPTPGLSKSVTDADEWLSKAQKLVPLCRETQNPFSTYITGQTGLKLPSSRSRWWAWLGRRRDEVWKLDCSSVSEGESRISDIMAAKERGIDEWYEILLGLLKEETRAARTARTAKVFKDQKAWETDNSESDGGDGVPETQNDEYEPILREGEGAPAASRG